MSEIMRPPVKITVGDTEFDAFDEAHTLADIARWVRAMSDKGGECADLIYLLQQESADE
jgi:hypothetical protein